MEAVVRKLSQPTESYLTILKRWMYKPSLLSPWHSLLLKQIILRRQHIKIPRIMNPRSSTGPGPSGTAKRLVDSKPPKSWVGRHLTIRNPLFLGSWLLIGNEVADRIQPSRVQTFDFGFM